MLISLLLVGCYAIDCVPYECITLGSNICARKSYQTVMINSESCQPGFRCSLQEVKNWHFTAEIDSLMQCEGDVVNPDYERENYDYLCGERKPKKEFASGNLPKECNSNTDCLLEDGTYTECICGLDGKAYCVPSWDSSAFEDFWSLCDQGIQFKDLYYWVLYKRNYPSFVSRVDCSLMLFQELNAMGRYLSILPVSGSTWLGVSLLLVILS